MWNVAAQDGVGWLTAVCFNLYYQHIVSDLPLITWVLTCPSWAHMPLVHGIVVSVYSSKSKEWDWRSSSTLAITTAGQVRSIRDRDESRTNGHQACRGTYLTLHLERKWSVSFGLSCSRLRVPTTVKVEVTLIRQVSWMFRGCLLLVETRWPALKCIDTCCILDQIEVIVVSKRGVSDPDQSNLTRRVQTSSWSAGAPRWK